MYNAPFPIHSATSLSPTATPYQAMLGACNTILSGTSRGFYAQELAGALSIKAVLAGSATWEVERHRYTVGENSYFVVNRGQTYNFTIDSAKPSTTFSIFFQHGFVEEIHRDLTTPAALLLDTPAEATACITFGQHLEPEPSDVIVALGALHAAKSAGSVSRTAIEEAFILLARALILESARTEQARSRLACVRPSTRRELMRRLLRGRDFLLSRMNESVTVVDAARAACMSRYHFLRVFHAAFQMTPHQFLTMQRLARARTLLRDGKHTVTDVCFESGFQSVASFSSLFRRHFGVPPSRFATAAN